MQAYRTWSLSGHSERILKRLKGKGAITGFTRSVTVKVSGLINR